jgi:signal transduction histidine kinase
VHPVLPALLEAIPDYALLLDEAGQVVALNQRLLELLGGQDPERFIGHRSGEAFGCSFSQSGDDGCGTSRLCPHCGARQAILASRAAGHQVSREVTLFLDRHRVLEAQVFASPLSIDGMAATLCVIRDLSGEKRQQMLERVFFHDIMNTLGGLRGVAELVRRDDVLPAEDQHRYRDWLLELVEQMVEEIDQQRKLLAAERGEFRPDLYPFSVAHLLEQVRHAYANHAVAEGRHLTIAPLEDWIVVSDPTILRRILGNLVKNALEAVPVGAEVIISANGDAEQTTFQVANPGVIPDAIQRQLFTRSVSSKAAMGRGIGTYSVKLFTERYLGGQIGFTSSGDQGTRFWITVPSSPAP